MVWRLLSAKLSGKSRRWLLSNSRPRESFQRVGFRMDRVEVQPKNFRLPDGGMRGKIAKALVDNVCSMNGQLLGN